MQNNDLTPLVRKFLQGSCTAEERKIVMDWWQHAVEDEAYLHQLSQEDRHAIQQRMLTAIKKGIATREPQLIPLQPKQKVGNKEASFKWYWAAAAVVVLALPAFLFLLSGPSSKTVVHTTAYGESREIVLPDQSVIILNGNSTLTYSDQWHKNEDRNVWLEGEAYFHVKHMVSHSPFIVHTTDDLKVKVLGTQFNVSNRRGITEVVLSEGKVKLEQGKAVRIMKPNEMVRYSKQERALVVQSVDALEKTSWKDRMLIFTDEPLGEIARKIEDSYGLKIVFKNQTLAEEVFSGSVPTDSINVFLDKVENLFHVTVKHEAGVYIFQ